MNAYGSEEDSDTETGTHRGGDIACQPTVIRTLDRQLALDDQTRRVEYPQHSEWSGDTVNGQPTVANFNNATTATTVTGSVGVTTSTGTGTTGTTPTIAAAAPDAVPAPTTTRTGNCSTPAAGSAPAPDGVTAPMAMMQQLVTTVGDLGLRLNNLQTARTGAATSHQASAAPGPSTYQATTMRATPSTTTRAGLGTDVTACAVVPTTSIPQQKNAKELDLQPFKPIAGGVRVEAWIAKVDLAVEGARISGRGDWSDEELYYVVGNKLQDVAAKSWVQIHKELARHERTWTKLKEALVRRYGERPDLVQAEWRVMQRTLQPGETFADFASGLRDAAGQNPVREETLLGQFYRELEKTTRQLVKLAPTTTTRRLMMRATMWPRGMRNIGQPWATSTTQAVNEQATFLKSRTEDEGDNDVGGRGLGLEQ
ncbi:hypothetical protein PC118_g23206 [Phytophthora cactorum]|uniref:Retrotransposon gag domain-containing protein n=1 Tax=Phytophthora cactorum TaxID=29920 RepID=A0A8T1EVP7_9STRA|nr:hypothetical protein PC114_g25967 [Phytophthora cactorum]KAG2959072.1 hypothetical protein PC118_g23206 [Phytophthora cactorum]